MIASVHIAKVGMAGAPGYIRRTPKASDVPGLRFAQVAIAAPLSARVLPPPPTDGTVGLVSVWEEEAALDVFLASHSLAEDLAGGWHVRLEPLRCSGELAWWPELADVHGSCGDEEPVAVLTWGRTRVRGLPRFLRTNAPASGDAAVHPAALATTGLAKPPRTIGTFSVWKSLAGMRDYAYTAGGGHKAAIDAMKVKDFHHESAFIRFRPYGSTGLWNGVDPVIQARDGAIAPV